MNYCMNYREETAGFSCHGENLVGIVARPKTPASTGVVVIVGGPQYRAGSHRQFVLLSRALASNGIAVLRFDYRGMGDSTGDLRDFEAVSQDVGAAIDALQVAVPEVKQIALWGLCDGASASLLFCHETGDSRVVGLCLLNPWVRSDASLAKTQVKHYYTQRLMQKEFWLKLAGGKVAGQAVRSLANNLQMAFFKRAKPANTQKSAPYQVTMALSWSKFTGSILLVLSGNDYTAKEFLEYEAANAVWSGAMNHPKLTRQDIAKADHTFSDSASCAEVNSLTLAWLARIAPEGRLA